jgi:hypothetical protein
LKTKPKSKTLKLIAEEILKLRLLMDELLETLDVMGSKEELEAIKKSIQTPKILHTTPRRNPTFRKLHKRR